eukprot:gene4806-5992_t
MDTSSSSDLLSTPIRYNPNPYSNFQPVSPFQYDFLNKFDHALSQDFADLDELNNNSGNGGVGGGGIVSNDNTYQTIDDSRIPNLDNSNPIFNSGIGLDNNRIVNDNDHYFNNQNISQNQSTSNIFGGGSGGDRSSNGRLSQDSFISRYRNRQSTAAPQTTTTTNPDQNQQQQQSQIRPQQQIPTNFNDSLEFNNLNETLINQDFSFNISNPNIEINDDDFYGHGRNEEDDEFNNSQFDNQQQQQLQNQFNNNIDEQQNEEEYINQGYSDSVLNNNRQNTPQNIFNGSTMIPINEQDSKTPGTYFSERSPSLGTLSGLGTPFSRPQFSDTPQRQHQQQQQNYVNSNNETDFRNSLNTSQRRSDNSEYLYNNHQQQQQQQLNSSLNGGGRNSLRSNHSGRSSLRYSDNDSSILTAQIPGPPSPLEHTPQRTNFDYNTYERLKEKFRDLIDQSIINFDNNKSSGNNNDLNSQFNNNYNYNNNNNNNNSQYIPPNNTDNQNITQNQQDEYIVEDQQNQYINNNRVGNNNNNNSENVSFTVSSLSSNEQFNSLNSHNNINNNRLPNNRNMNNINNESTNVNNNNNIIIPFPVLIVEKVIDFGKCERGWILKKNLVIVNPHSQPIVIVSHFLNGADKDEFKVLVPPHIYKSFLLVNPSASITLQIEYSPTSFRNHQSVLQLICSPLSIISNPTTSLHHNNVHINQQTVSIDIQLNGECTNLINTNYNFENNAKDLLLSYNSWDLGECFYGQKLESTLSVDFPFNHKLLYETNGEGFSFKKLPNNEISISFSPVFQKQLYNGEISITDSETGQKKIIKLSAGVKPLLDQQTNPFEKNNIPTPSPPLSNQSPLTFIQKQQPKTTTNNNNNNVKTNIQLSKVPIKISNFVMENGINFIYQERNYNRSITNLPVESTNFNGNIQVECISTVPDIFVVTPTNFIVGPGGIELLTIQYLPLKDGGGTTTISHKGALLISTPSIKEKLKIDLYGTIEPSIPLMASPPSPHVHHQKYHYQQRPSPPQSPLEDYSPNNYQANYNNNNTTVIFDRETEISQLQSQSTIPSLFCNKRVVSFGGVRLGDSKSLKITLTSTLPKSLHLKTSFEQGNQFFSIYSGASILVSPNSSSEVEVTYTPLSVASHFDTLTFTSVYTDMVFSVPIRGFGGRAKMEIISPVRYDSNNNPILYVNRPNLSNGGIGSSCFFTIKNTGQRPGFIKSIASYPNSTIHVNPSALVLGVGQQHDIHLSILPLNKSNQRNLEPSSSTISPGKIKIYFGDEQARSRRRKTMRLQSQYFTEDATNIFDDDFLFEDDFQDDEIIKVSNDDADEDDNTPTMVDIGFDDLELFDDQISSIKITPIVGEPPSSNSTIPNNNNTNTFNNFINNDNLFSTPQHHQQNPNFKTTTNQKKTQFTQEPKFQEEDTTESTPTTTDINNNNLLNSFSNSITVKDENRRSQSPVNNSTTKTTTVTKSDSQQKPNSKEVHHHHHHYNHIQPSNYGGKKILFIKDRSIVFPPAVPNGTTVAQVPVSNASSTPLTVILYPLEDPFHHKYSQITLNPKTTTKVPVTFTPENPGKYIQILKLKSIPNPGDPILFCDTEIIGELHGDYKKNWWIKLLFNISWSTNAIHPEFVQDVHSIKGIDWKVKECMDSGFKTLPKINPSGRIELGEILSDHQGSYKIRNCPKCKLICDRDLNAAHNIMIKGTCQLIEITILL